MMNITLMFNEFQSMNIRSLYSDSRDGAHWVRIESPGFNSITLHTDTRDQADRLCALMREIAGFDDLAASCGNAAESGVGTLRPDPATTETH